MSKKVPGSREEDVWLTEDELAQCDRADDADTLHSPVPTQMISNGEFLPAPQSEDQKRVEARVKELAEKAAKKLGISRRRFLGSSGGMAASFLAMNEVYGQFFDVDPIEMFEPAAAAKRGVPKNLFAFDSQLHLARGNFNHTLLYPLRAVAQGSTTPGFSSNPFNPTGLPDEFGNAWGGWNPSAVGLPLTPDSFDLIQFVKMVFFDSQVTGGVVTGAPGVLAAGHTTIEEATASEVLTAQQACAVRDFVNGISESQRLFAHGRLYPGKGNLDWIRHQAEVFKPDSWKGYMSPTAKADTNPGTPMTLWRLDDEKLAYPTYEVISEYQQKFRRTRPGWGNICIHKGLGPAVPDLPERGNPIDLPKAATDWPNLNFIMYHSCFTMGFFPFAHLQNVQSGHVLRNGVPDIPWTTQFAQITAPHPNVYAELGCTFAASVSTFPTVWAHIIGQLLKYMGDENIVFGSDCIWWGDPQWQLEAFWRFQIPESIRHQWGYPEITETNKRNILGLNSAKLYGLDLGTGKAHDERDEDDRNRRRHDEDDGDDPQRATFGPVPSDYVSRMSDSLKTIMEFPGFRADRLQRHRDEYLAAGGFRGNTRFGWVRTRD
jgi:hypothetical protein